MSANVSTLTAANFDAEVLASPVPVLVYFKANWCPPCTALTPIVERFADEYAGRIKVGALDIDAHAPIAHRYIGTQIPICVAFQGGQKGRGQPGIASHEQLVALFDF